MIYRDPKCVFVANDSASANLILGLLEGAGFPAQVMNEIAASGSEGAAGSVTGSSHKGVEVCVTNPDHVEPAKTFIEEEMAAAAAERQKRATRTGTVVATCEDCGKSSEWPASAMGTTEVCPHCAAYIDVPDPDEDWSDVDVGDGEGENEVEK